MIKVNLFYYSRGINGSRSNWFKFFTEGTNGGYSSESCLKRGDEDLRAIDLFLNMTRPDSVDLNFLDGPMNLDQQRKLEKRINDYNRQVSNSLTLN